MHYSALGDGYKMLDKLIPNDVFYFGRHFAPVVIPSVQDTPEKRFGYVLAVMRKAKNIRQDELEKLINPDSTRGGSTISDWEIARKSPKATDLPDIFTALELDGNDSDYLSNLLYGNPASERLNEIEIDEARLLFKPFAESDSPAYLIDHHWNILETNEATQRLLRLPTHVSSQLVGKNLLNFVLNPVFNTIDILGGIERWSEIALGQIWGFRAATSHMRFKQWYIDLIHSLASGEGYQFLHLWYREPPEYFDPGKPFEFEVNPLPDVTRKYTLKYHVRLFTGLKKAEVVEWYGLS